MSFLKKLLGGGEKEPPPEVAVVNVSGTDVGNLEDVVKQALEMQQHYAGQVQQDQSQMSVSELMNLATQNMEQLTGQKAEPRTAFVKRTPCHNCGGAKTLAPKTAYVYCDFCGSLTDYDFQKACENPQASMPGPAYEALVRETNGDAALARETK